MGEDTDNENRRSSQELPDKIDLDGLSDRRHKDIRYIGVATRQPDGRYFCLAEVSGALCRVSVYLRSKEDIEIEDMEKALRKVRATESK